MKNPRQFFVACLSLLVSCSAMAAEEDLVANAICGPTIVNVVVQSSGRDVQVVTISRGFTVYTNQTVVLKKDNEFKVVYSESYFDGDDFGITLHLGEGNIEEEIQSRQMNAQERLSGLEPRLIKEAVNLYKLISERWPISSDQLQAIGSDCNSGIWAYEDWKNSD